MSSTATKIRQISLVCVPTLDQDRAIEFYESVGFEKRTDTSFGDKYRWVEVFRPKGRRGSRWRRRQPDRRSRRRRLASP